MVKPGVFIGDRYEIISKIGSGGMADVYKARCHRLNRFVAIKILKQEYSDDKKFVDKFRAEAQSAAGLSHPNIVNVYDVGEDEGLYYIVMELVEGITLKSFIERKGKLEIKEATGIA
ncbi:MAG: protein kinase, partial [Acetivibrio sp.]